MDYPVRSYLVYADTDEEMNSWISAINSEIQPVTGQRGNTFSNVKIDEKAFDEVSSLRFKDTDSLSPSLSSPLPSLSYPVQLMRILN